MRRVVLLAVLALALPTAALADSFDYGNVGGTLTGSNAAGWTITSTSQLTIQDITTNTLVTGSNLGTCVLTTGAVSGGVSPAGHSYHGNRRRHAVLRIVHQWHGCSAIAVSPSSPVFLSCSGCGSVRDYEPRWRRTQW